MNFMRSKKQIWWEGMYFAIIRYIIVTLVLSWVVSFLLCAILWFFVYYFAPFFDARKDNISVLEPCFSAKRLSTRYILRDWYGAYYGDALVVLEDKEMGRRFLVYVFREMPDDIMNKIFDGSSDLFPAERNMRILHRSLGGVYEEEIDGYLFECHLFYYKKESFKLWQVRGLMIEEKLGEAEGRRYKWIRGYIAQLGGEKSMIWTFRNLRATNDVEMVFPYMEVVCVEEKPQKLYVIPLVLEGSGVNVEILRDFVRDYFHIDIRR